MFTIPWVDKYFSRVRPWHVVLIWGPFTAWMLWLANLIFAGNQIHYVQIRIHSAKLVGARAKLARAWAFAAGQFVMAAVLAATCLLGWMPWVIRGAQGAWQQGGRTSPAAIVGAMQMLAGAPEAAAGLDFPITEPGAPIPEPMATQSADEILAAARARIQKRASATAKTDPAILHDAPPDAARFAAR